jgi:hypothetical protein
MREWLWWPSVKSHAVACGIAFVAVTLLGIAEIPRFPTFKEFTTVQASPPEFFVLSAVIAVANACFLFLHARGDYLTARSGFRPMALSFLLLSGVFPLAWGAFRILFKHAPLPDVFALASGAGQLINGAKLSDASALEWTRAARAVFVGEGGLTMVLLFSGLWKPPPQDTVDLSGMLDRARPLLRRVFKHGEFLTEAEHERLKALLMTLGDGAEKLRTRGLSNADLAVVDRLTNDTRTVLTAVTRPLGALPNFRTNANEDVLAAVNSLLGDHDP